MRHTVRHIFSFLSIFFFSLHAFAGQEGNGGDRRALEFVGIASTVASILHDKPIVGINANQLSAEIAVVKVEVTDHQLTLNGVLKDAINYPNEKRIVFNGMAWDRNSDYLAKAAFALHEYLGVMLVDDSSYQISKNVLRGLWFISGIDGETMIDILSENKFMIDEAVHGVARMANAEEIVCSRDADAFVVSYDCTITGPGYGGKLKQVRVIERKAREIWTLLSSFQIPSCGSKRCTLAIRKIECQGENTRDSRPAVCTSSRQ